MMLVALVLAGMCYGLMLVGVPTWLLWILIVICSVSVLIAGVEWASIQSKIEFLEKRLDEMDERRE